MSHVILVAFQVDCDSRDLAERHLRLRLPFETGPIESWWIAEDARLDQGDNDSAVFVHKGAQRQAVTLLRRENLTASVNLAQGQP